MKTDSNFNAPQLQAQVTANGHMKKVTLPCSLIEFLKAQNLRPQGVVVEYNGQALAPSEFSQILLADRDRLEIVQVVAGG